MFIFSPQLSSTTLGQELRATSHRDRISATADEALDYQARDFVLQDDATGQVRRHSGNAFRQEYDLLGLALENFTGTPGIEMQTPCETPANGMQPASSPFI